MSSVKNASSYPNTAFFLREAENYANRVSEEGRNKVESYYPAATVLLRTSAAFLFPMFSTLVCLFEVGCNCAHLNDEDTEVRAFLQKKITVGNELAGKPELLKKVQGVFDKQIEILNHSIAKKIVRVAAQTALGVGAAHSNQFFSSINTYTKPMLLGSGVYSFLTGILSMDRDQE